MWDYAMCKIDIRTALCGTQPSQLRLHKMPLNGVLLAIQPVVLGAMQGHEATKAPDARGANALARKSSGKTLKSKLSRFFAPPATPAPVPTSSSAPGPPQPLLRVWSLTCLFF